ncbi:MAG TPA: ROK family protein [Clostridiales bacterium]|nr:ROK family protein [Clostridiales bacterium]
MKSYRIGIDAGGTKVAYGLFDEKNNLLDRFQHPTPIEADGPAFSDLVIENVGKLLQQNNKTIEDLQGIGICMPSFILFDQGYVCMTSAMVNIRDFPMRDYLTQRLQVPVILDNDGNAAALAEHRFGAGRGSRHMIYMAISTGIGSGLVLNGQLFRGSYGWAGESGHMLITPDEGLLCGCRNQGCFMSWASGRYIPQHIRQKAEGRHTSMDLDSGLDCVELCRGCREGDALALEILDQMAHYIALCIFNIYQLLNVNLFVFGGGVVNFGPLLFDRVRAEFDRYNHIPQPVEFRFAELEENIGVIGAAELVRELL